MERLSISVRHRAAVLAPHEWSAYNLTVQSARAVSSVVRAPRSHRGGRRFKSSIAHHAAWTNQTESWPSCQALACRGGGTADALRSGRSVLTDVWVQIPPSAPINYSPFVWSDYYEQTPADIEDEKQPGGDNNNIQAKTNRFFKHDLWLPLPLLCNSLSPSEGRFYGYSH